MLLQILRCVAISLVPKVLKENFILKSAELSGNFFRLRNDKNANNYWHFNIYEQEKAFSAYLGLK